jgi:hypothetical protein
MNKAAKTDACAPNIRELFDSTSVVRASSHPTLLDSRRRR